MNSLETLLAHQTPTSARPLLGQTILAVEDSRFACETLRLMCQKSGARLRRADCLAHARRHLATYRPSVLIVDLGLPDGDGTELIREMAHARPRFSAILATSGDDTAQARAIKAGADGFLAKPFGGLGAFQTKVLSVLPRDRHPNGPRPLIDDLPAPDPVALCDDLRLVGSLLEQTGSDREISYAAQFTQALGRCAGDQALHNAADRLASDGIGTGARRLLRTLVAARIQTLSEQALTPRGATP